MGNASPNSLPLGASVKATLSLHTSSSYAWSTLHCSYSRMSHWVIGKVSKQQEIAFPSLTYFLLMISFCLPKPPRKIALPSRKFLTLFVNFRVKKSILPSQRFSSLLTPYPPIWRTWKMSSESPPLEISENTLE